MHDWLQKKRQAEDRGILLWAHALIGGATWCLYLYNIDLPTAAFLLPTAGMPEILIGLPVLLPYLVSAGYSWGLYSDPYVIHNRRRLSAFILVLVVGAALTACFIVAPAGYFERTDLIPVLAFQMGAYMWAAELLLNLV
jgi:hypothetical protein